MATELNFALLEKLGSLKNGGHSGPSDGACVMEAVAYVAGEKWSDHPECVSPVIGAFLRNWNDNLPTDADRDRLLKPLIPVIINTRSTRSVEEQRSYLALDWMIRTFLPKWLRLAKINDHADKVEALSPIIDMETAKAAGLVVRAANEAASKAGAAAWDAAWAAARDAAWDAAVAAAVAAAGDAAWDAAGDAAVAAARAAARDAAWDALKETRDQLQLSAVDLVKRMAALS